MSEHDLRRQPCARAHRAWRSRSDGGATRRRRVHEDGPLRVRVSRRPARELEACSSTPPAASPAATVGFDIAVGAGARARGDHAPPPRKVYRALGADADVDVRLQVARRRDARLAAAGDDPVRRARGSAARIDVDLAADAPLCWPKHRVRPLRHGRDGAARRAARPLARPPRRPARSSPRPAARRRDRGQARAAGRCATARVAIATVLIAPGDEAATTRACCVPVLPARSASRPGTASWSRGSCAQDGDGAAARSRRGADRRSRGTLPRLWSN